MNLQQTLQLILLLIHLVVTTSGDDGTGLLISQLEQGIYQLVIYLDVADLIAPCNYTVNTNMEIYMYDDECMFTCNKQ